jgi:hypothetical protein
MYHTVDRTYPKEEETTSFPAACLALPFAAGLEAGLEAAFVLTFFGGGATFWQSNGKDKKTNTWATDLNFLSFCSRGFLRYYRLR